MRLISLLAALCAERFLDIRKPKNSYHWLQVYAEKLQAYTKGSFLEKQSWGAVAALLIPLLLVVLLVTFLFSNWLFGIVGIILDFVLLWYCLGPGDLRDELNQYRAPNHDSSVTQAYAEAIVDDNSVDLSGPGRDRAVTQALFWQAHERSFALIFWFVILGGFGAALYRLTWYFKRLAAEHNEQQLETGCTHLHGILAWLPTRILALSYLLAGNFHPGITRLKGAMIEPGNNKALLINCGADALGIDFSQPGGEDSKVEQQEAMELISRALLLWVMVISLITTVIIIF